MDAPLIVSDPAVMMGKPVVADTRLTSARRLGRAHAGVVVRRLAGMTPDDRAEGASAVFRDRAALHRTTVRCVGFRPCGWFRGR